MYGRLPVYHTCNVLFVVFNLACGASTSLSMLIVFRFFAGLFGVCPVTLGGGTIADVTTREQRGKAMAAWLMGPVC
jgi:MFS family permease